MGRVVDVEVLAPSVMNDERFKKWWASYLRHSASPADALALAMMNSDIGIRNILPAIHVPTLIIHRTGDRDSSVEESKYMTREIPNAKFIELPGADHMPWVGDTEKLLNEV